jgi:hypothetical protein
MVQADATCGFSVFGDNTRHLCLPAGDRQAARECLESAS